MPPKRFSFHADVCSVVLHSRQFGLNDLFEAIKTGWNVSFETPKLSQGSVSDDITSTRHQHSYQRYFVFICVQHYVFPWFKHIVILFVVCFKGRDNGWCHRPPSNGRITTTLTTIDIKMWWIMTGFQSFQMRYNPTVTHTGRPAGVGIIFPANSLDNFWYWDLRRPVTEIPQSVTNHGASWNNKALKMSLKWLPCDLTELESSRQKKFYDLCAAICLTANTQGKLALVWDSAA